MLKLLCASDIVLIAEQKDRFHKATNRMSYTFYVEVVKIIFFTRKAESEVECERSGGGGEV